MLFFLAASKLKVKKLNTFQGDGQFLKYCTITPVAGLLAGMLCYPFCALLTGTAVAPDSLMVCLLLSWMACWDGQCCGFVHGVFAAFVCWLARMAIALVLLMVCLPLFVCR